MKSIVRDCGNNVFKYIETLVVIMNCRIIYLYSMLMKLSAQEDPKQLQSASEMAVMYINFPYNCSVVILFMGFKLLEIFRFSIVANLTVSTVMSGFSQIVNVLIIFVVVTSGEAIAGYFVFGYDVESYRSIQASFTTLIRTLNGDFSPI